MNPILSSISFLILIGVLVVVHELGHLIAARLNGVFAEIFSVGFGPVIFERQDKKGTKWRISLFPIGGYVRMFGDADASSVQESTGPGYSEEDLERMSLHRKKPWQKIIVALSGPLANLIFALFVFLCVFSIKGAPEYTNLIKVDSKESIAFVSGLRTEDRIIAINNSKINTFEDIYSHISESSGKDMLMTIKRGNETKNINIKMYAEKDGKIVPEKVLGVAPSELSYKKLAFFESFRFAVASIYKIAEGNLMAMSRILVDTKAAKSVGNIISIFKVSAESAERGIFDFIWVLGMLSVILGVVNLLPIPVLDGGTIVISAIEWIIGRPLNKKFVETIFVIGLVVVVSLMLLGLWNDIWKYFVK